MLGHLVGEADAVNDGDRRKHSQHPQNGRHGSPAVKESPKNDEHDALRTLHEANLALTDQNLGPGARIAHHQRDDHDKGGKNDVKESITAGIENQQPEKQNHVGVAVDDRIEKRAEDRHLLRLASNAAVYHVENARANDHQPG